MYELTGNIIKSIPENIFNGVRLFIEKELRTLLFHFRHSHPLVKIQKYNYINNISSRNALLSFLDSDLPEKDPRGTYYLDFISDDIFAYIKSIGKIIEGVAEKNDISKDKIYLIGSSKGAVGALLCAFVCGYDNVIVNAPQFRIGSNVKRRSTDVLNLMLSKYDMYFLDTIILDLYSSADSEPNNVIITCGVDDLYHLKEVEMYEVPLLQKKSSIIK